MFSKRVLICGSANEADSAIQLQRLDEGSGRDVTVLETLGARDNVVKSTQESCWAKVGWKRGAQALREHENCR